MFIHWRRRLYKHRKMCGANLTGYLESPPMKTETPSVKIVAIAADEAGQRIDNFLRTQLKGVPKSMIYRILRKGEVRVNKKRIKPEYKLESGDEVRIPPVRVAEREEEAVSPHLQKVAALADVILYEDDHILVLNKPSGTAVHGGSGLSFGVIEGLRALHPEARFLELVHRLDRDTSGVLLVAKKRSALRSLHEQLREKGMQKDYLALVRGQWQSHVKTVQAPLLKNILQSGERIVRVSQEGKPSETRASRWKSVMPSPRWCAVARSRAVRIRFAYIPNMPVTLLRSTIATATVSLINSLPKREPVLNVSFCTPRR